MKLFNFLTISSLAQGQIEGQGQSAGGFVYDLSAADDIIDFSDYGIDESSFYGDFYQIVDQMDEQARALIQSADTVESSPSIGRGLYKPTVLTLEKSNAEADIDEDINARIREKNPFRNQATQSVNVVDFVEDGKFDNQAFMEALRNSFSSDQSDSSAKSDQSDDSEENKNLKTEKAPEVELDTFRIPSVFERLPTENSIKPKDTDRLVFSAPGESYSRSHISSYIIFKGNRPGTGSEPEVESKTFVGDDANSVGAEVPFSRCRVCDSMTAAECALAPIVECPQYPEDDQTDDRVCQISYRVRWSPSNPNPEVLFTSGCAARESCLNNAAQNFVGPILHHQCRPYNRLNYRFRHTVCHTCTQLTATGSDDNSIFRTGSDELIQGHQLQTIINNPRNYFELTNIYQQGYLFTLQDYTINN